MFGHLLCWPWETQHETPMHQLPIHQCWQVRCHVSAKPVLECNNLSGIHATGLGAANQPIHKSLEILLFRSGDQQWEGNLWFPPKSPDLWGWNSCSRNRTVLVWTIQVTSMYNICFGPKDTVRDCKVRGPVNHSLGFFWLRCIRGALLHCRSSSRVT